MLLFQPLWTVFALGWVLGAQLFGFLYIFTADEPEVQNGTGVIEWETSDTLFYMKWYYFFGTSRGAGCSQDVTPPGALR